LLRRHSSFRTLICLSVHPCRTIRPAPIHLSPLRLSPFPCHLVRSWRSNGPVARATTVAALAEHERLSSTRPCSCSCTHRGALCELATGLDTKMVRPELQKPFGGLITIQYKLSPIVSILY
jgi:hypothetical protein